MNIKWDRKWTSLVILNMCLGSALLCKNSYYPQQEKITVVDQRLAKIETKLNQPQQQPDLSPITNNLQQLSGFIQQLQNKDDHQLGEVFSTEQVAIKKQLDGITELLRHLDEQKQPVQMLPITSLPFTVMSIDSIQETSVATVSYDYKTKALEKGDDFAGWTVIELDFSKQNIEFVNTDKAHVLVHLTPFEVEHD